MARIFINYRRDDTQGVAGRLFDYLASKYSHDELFMDVDAMKPGLDFTKQLDAQVAQCQVLLAVIGPHWLDAHDQAGKRRLDNDKDYVRIELASALKRDIALIPVLVDGASMPSEDNLSDDLKPLARRHALELRHTRFNADADAIMHALEAVVPRSRIPWRYVGAGAVVALGIAVAVAWPKLSARPHQPPPPPIASSEKPATANPPAALAQQRAAAPAPASAATPSGLPAGDKLGEMMKSVALRGSLYRATDIAADPAVCQAACRADTHCSAWTYTQPNASGSSARCSLKAVIPEQFADVCCTSGIEREPPPELRVPPPVPADVSGALAGIELEGATYRHFEGDDATPEGCQAACHADGQCLAWDYVRPGIYNADSHCFLKNNKSVQISSPCCIAGLERQTAAVPAAASASAAPAIGSAPMVNTDLHGASYRNFELPSDNATLCQSACKADTQCLAWTAVHPGLQGPNARCWLKNSVPPPTANSCCTSGIERAASK
jgi:PAN domain/TIR domain